LGRRPCVARADDEEQRHQRREHDASHGGHLVTSRTGSLERCVRFGLWINWRPAGAFYSPGRRAMSSRSE
jgi:hypothetical protein